MRAGDAKEIVFASESRRRLQVGINKVADAVAVTLGPRGAHCSGNWPCVRRARYPAVLPTTLSMHALTDACTPA